MICVPAAAERNSNIVTDESISNYQKMKSTFLLFLLLSLIYVNRLSSQKLFSAGSERKFFSDSSTILNDSGFYIKSTDGKSFLKIYGSIRLNGAYDIDGLQSQQNFSTYDI